MELSQETRDAIIAIAKKVVAAFSEAVKKFCEWLCEKWEWIKAAVVKLYQLEEEKKIVKRQRYKRDFGRQRFSHQNMDRRPRHTVRKVIR